MWSAAAAYTGTCPRRWSAYDAVAVV
jgi:hypothetical protein